MHTELSTPPHTDCLAHSWTDANERALAFAHDAQWDDAAELWEQALLHAPAFALEPDTHALLLSNLAQARFRCGQLDAAVTLGRRSVAARLLCCDTESDAPVARAHADLAVYLTALGESEEAASLLEQARESLEQHFGDEDGRLLSVLENQARLALVTGDAAIAEPTLLRLHALIDARGEDPSCLDHLIARVAASRGAVMHTAASHDVSHATDDVDSPADHPSAHVPADDVAVFPQIMDDEFDLIDDTVHTPMSSPSAQSIRSEGLIEPGSHSTPGWSAKTNPLGFEVLYGVPSDESYAVPPHLTRDQ